MRDLLDKIALRPMTETDLDAVLEIETSSFSRPWTRGHFLDELASPFGFPTVAILPDETVAGYLCLKQVVDEAEILDVAVNPAFRGHGVGRLLVEHAFGEARGKGAAALCLEVRVGNVEAVSLYRRMGFEETGRRKRYYDNGEDAILMQRGLQGQAL